MLNKLPTNELLFIKIATCNNDNNKLINYKQSNDKDPRFISSSANIYNLSVLYKENIANDGTFLNFYSKDNEKKLLETFWALVNSHNKLNIVTWCGLSYDIPFIYQKSVKHDVTTNSAFPPFSVINTFNADRYIDYKIIDLAKIWSCNKPCGNCPLIPTAFDLNIVTLEEASFVNDIFNKTTNTDILEEKDINKVSGIQLKSMSEIYKKLY